MSAQRVRRQALSTEDFAADSYADLRRIAASYLRRRPTSASLEPTMLVHESLLKLMQRARLRPNDRDHFLALSARIMRQLIVDHARRSRIRTRSRARMHAPHDRAQAAMTSDGRRAIEIEEALERLALLDARQAQIVELRFFGGLDTESIARILRISRRTVELDWRMAKAWLRLALSGD